LITEFTKISVFNYFKFPLPLLLPDQSFPFLILRCFLKFRKATVSFVMPMSLSVSLTCSPSLCSRERTRLPMDGLS